MQKVCYYIAKDGKKFEERDECIRYEFKMALTEHNLYNQLFFFNESKEQIDISDNEYFENVCAIIVKDGNALQEYYDIAIDTGIYDEFAYSVYGMLKNLDSKLSGVWVYDYDNDEWQNLNEEADKIANKLEYWTK